MFETLTATEVAKGAGVGTVALISIAFSLQKLLKNWNSTSAENNVTTLMRSELDRLAQQNSLLMAELSSFQTQVLDLNKALITLTGENQRLRSEVANFTEELGNLSNENQRLHQEVTSLTQQIALLKTTLNKKE